MVCSEITKKYAEGTILSIFVCFSILNFLNNINNSMSPSVKIICVLRSCSGFKNTL